jgi:hypothetical protein
MSLPASIRINPQVPFPALVTGSGLVAVSKNNGIWTISLNFTALAQQQVVVDPTNTYVLAYNVATGVSSLVQIAAASSAKNVKVLTAAGPYAALPSDDVLIVKQLVGAAFTVTVDWSQRARPLRIVDGKGDANVNNITITPTAGQTQLATVNYSYIIDGAGGSITLTPLPDNSGAY